MQNKRLTLSRLQKQQMQLEKQPIKGVLVKRSGTFNFHFCLYQLESPYDGGYYHAVLQLPQNYPFAAPKLIFYTESGRFQVGVPICTTFTNYHQESWTSAWNVRTLILATISFMLSNQHGYGCKNSTPDYIKKCAGQSLKKNLQNQLFVQLFGQKLQQMGIQIIKKKENQVKINQDQFQVKNQAFIAQEEVQIKPIDNNQRENNKIKIIHYGVLVGAVLVGTTAYFLKKKFFKL